MEINDFAGSGKTNPIQTQTNPIKPNFKGKKEKDFATKAQIPGAQVPGAQGHEEKEKLKVLFE